MLCFMRAALAALWLLLLIHTFSILSLQLKKLQWHNESAINLSNANPARSHIEVRRSTDHNAGTFDMPTLPIVGVGKRGAY